MTRQSLNYTPLLALGAQINNTISVDVSIDNHVDEDSIEPYLNRH